MIGDDIELYTTATADEVQLFLNLSQTAQFVHEEHGQIAVEQGVWEIRRQREYDPLANRTVYD
jgi:hypothetical protein